MKYNQFAIKNQDGLYIKYSTAYRDKLSFTSSLYDVHLWNLKEEAEKIAGYLMKNEGYKKLTVVEV